MARRSSKTSKGKDELRETPADDLPATGDTAGTTPDSLPGDDTIAHDEAATEASAAADETPVEAEARTPDTEAAPEDGAPLDPEAAAAETTETVETGETVAEGDETVADTTDTPSEPPPELEKPAEPAATRTVVERRGPGFVPLALGGAVAAALGFFAASYDVIPGLAPQDGTASLEAALARQSETLAALEARMADLVPAEAPAVDLGPVTDRLDALGTRLDETSATLGETAASVATLTDRVATLEERPVFTGDVSADTAEAADAVAAMEEQVRAREEEAARLAAEAEAARAEA
ncbi:hypothetical protein P6F26_18995, partial [Roseibacterium sp. SDUM158017]|nr:hypothetical protein [Roseibacterium sp. SDUM158017]